MDAPGSSRGGAYSSIGAPASSTGTVGYDLLIVGAGALGRMVAEMWRKEFPRSRIYALTLTADHHTELMEMGIRPSVKGTKLAYQFPYVIFCAPPYQNLESYTDEVREATLNWNREGCFLFTSSSVLYDCKVDRQICDEDTPSVPIGRRARDDILLNTEQQVLGVGGCVLRLARLYKADRGPHMYCLEKGTVDMSPDQIVNLIHYEDAASLSVAILQKRFRHSNFLGCDNQPLSRRGLMDVVACSGKYDDKKFEAFTGKSPPLRAILDNSKTCAKLRWQPKYGSILAFLNTLPAALPSSPS